MMNKNKKLILLFSVLGLVLLTACTKDGESISQGDFSLNQNELDAYLKLKNIRENAETRRKRALRNLIERNALAEVIAQEDVVKNPMIAIEIKELRNEALIKRYLEMFQRSEISDKAIKDHYENNKDKYTIRKLRVAHILIRSYARMNDARKRADFKLAQDIHKQLKKGAKFETLVKKYSKDVLTKKKKGELGWIQTGKGDPVLLEVASRLEIGDISEPVETAKGIHIVKLLEKAEQAATPLEQVKQEIRYRLGYEAKLAEMKRLKDKASSRTKKELARAGVDS